LLGRVSTGDGPAELIPLKGFAATIGGYLGPTFTLVTAGNGITNTSNTLTVEWNAGTVDTLGAGLNLNGGHTLSTGWQAGTVTAIGANLTISGGTLSAIVQPQQWSAGTVTALGTSAAGTLSISGTTLSATYNNPWQAGTVTAIGQNLLLNLGTLDSLGPFASWSVTDFAVGGTYNPPTITNQNRTIVQSGGAGNQITVDRATIPQTTGKWYVEETMGANVGNGGIVRLGIMQNSATIALPSGGSSGALLWDSSGTVYVNGTSITVINSYTAADVLSMAVDMTNTGFYGRVNGGNWNNAGTADPANNIGSISFAALTGAINLVFYAQPFSHAQASITLNSGASGMVHTVPSGYAPGWPYAGLIGGAGAVGPTGPTVWNAGSVSAIHAGLTITSQTLIPDWQAGTVTTLHSGITLASSTLVPDWQAGVVSSLHSGLTLAAGSLASDWQTGTVSSLHAGLTLTAGALATDWQSGTVTTIGPTLALSSSTLNAVGLATGSLPAAGAIGELITAKVTEATSTVTLTLGSPGTVNWTAHGLSALSAVQFSTTGSLPTGLATVTTYYVTAGASLTTNAFRVSTTINNAIAGTSINFTGSQTGTQSAFNQAAVFNSTNTDLVAIQVPAGVWDIYGVFHTADGSSATMTSVAIWVNNVSVTQPAAVLGGGNTMPGVSANQAIILDTGTSPRVLSTLTTFFLTCQVLTSTAIGVGGAIWARRVG
jgi:hypothetical protein